MSLSVLRSRRSSPEIASATSGSVERNASQSATNPSPVSRCSGISAFSSLDLGDLLEPSLVTSALERRIEPELEDLPRQLHGHDAASHREHVRVVVAARQVREVQVVAERGPGTLDLVGGKVLPLSRPAEYDPA